MATPLELSLRITANASDAIRSLLETRRSLQDVTTALQTQQARVAELAREQQAAQRRADELRVQHSLGQRALQELGQQVSRTSPEYRALSAQVRQLATESRAADRAAENQTRAFVSARDAASALASRQDALRETSHRTRQALQVQGVDVSQLASEYRRLQQAERQAAAEQPLRDDARRLSQQYQNPYALHAQQQAALNAHLSAGRINQDTYNRALADYNRQLQAATGNVGGMGNALQTMGHIAAGLFAADKVFDLGKAIYNTTAQFERIDALLKTVTGSSEAASEQMEWLTAITDELGLSVATTAQQYAFYAAAAKEAGFSQDETNRVFHNFISAISGLQLSQDKAERVMYALTQMTTKPKVALEELQLQLGDSLPGVINKAARAIGKDTDFLYDKISKGELVSAEFIKAFSQVLADDFPALTEGAAQSANRLENAWIKAKLEFGESGFTDAVANTLDKLTESINGQTPALEQWGESLGKLITLLSDHGQEAGAGLSALLIGARFGLPGAVIGGGLSYLAGEYLDSQQAVPDMTFKAGDSQDSLRQKIANTQAVIKQIMGNAFIADDKQAELIQQLSEHKHALLTELAAAVARESQTTADKLTFDPNKGFKQGDNQGQTKELSQAELAAQLARIESEKQTLKALTDNRLQQLTADTKAKELALEQQHSAELLSADELKQQLIALKASEAEQELAIKRELIEQQADLEQAALNAKINAEKRAASDYGDLINAAQQKYALPNGLIAAVMQVESAGKKDAVSKAGAAGLMQLMPETAKGLGVTDRFDPAQSIEGGAKLLRQLLDDFNGDIKLALAAYNAKPSTVKKFQAGQGDLPNETKAYIPKVLGEMQNPTGKSSSEQQTLNAKLQTLYTQREAIEADKIAKLKALGITEQSQQTEQASAELALTEEQNARKKALANELSQAQHDAALDDLALKEQALQQSVDLGQTSQAEQLTQLKTFAAERLSIELKLLEGKRKLLGDDKLAMAQNLNQQAELMRNFGLTIQGYNNDLAKTSKAQFAELFAPLTNALDQSVNGILSGQQTISNAARNAAQSVVVSYLQQSIKTRAIKAADWLYERLGMARVLGEKKELDVLGMAWDGLMWARKRVRKTLEWAWEISGLAGVEARKKAIKQAGELWQDVLDAGRMAKQAALWLWDELGFGKKEAAKAGMAAGSEALQCGIAEAGAQTRGEIEDKANAESSLKMAWQAAKGAFKSVMEVVPFPFNVVLAPIAGAAAFAGTMALGSSKGGEYYVDGDDKPYLLHKNETVLPSGVADNFRTVVDIVKHSVGWAVPTTTGALGDAVGTAHPSAFTRSRPGGRSHEETATGAIIEALRESGQLKPLTLPDFALNLAADSQASANIIAGLGKQAQAELASLQTHQIVEATQKGAANRKAGDTNHFTINATDADSVTKLLMRNGDTIARIARDKAKSGNLPRTR